MGVEGRRYDCFLCMTGEVKETVYFCVPVQETCLFMHLSVSLEEAKGWIFIFFLLLRHRKTGELFSFFCGRGRREVCLYTYQQLQKGKYAWSVQT